MDVLAAHARGPARDPTLLDLYLAARFSEHRLHPDDVDAGAEQSRDDRRGAGVVKDWRAATSAFARRGHLRAGTAGFVVRHAWRSSGSPRCAAVLVADADRARGPTPGFDRAVDRRHGARSEVQDLTWSMVGRDGHVSERVVRRLREVAGRGWRGTGSTWPTRRDARAIAARRRRAAFRTLTRTRSPRPRCPSHGTALDAPRQHRTTRNERGHMTRH